MLYLLIYKFSNYSREPPSNNNITLINDMNDMEQFYCVL